MYCPHHYHNLQHQVYFPGSFSLSKKFQTYYLPQELMKYCSALTCVQQLEAQHHYLNQKLSIGRASLPASTCAYLRRRMNNDVLDSSFRKNLGRYIENLSSLVCAKWSTRSEPLQLIRGKYFFQYFHIFSPCQHKLNLWS